MAWPTAAPDPEAALASTDEVARIQAAIATLPANLKDPLTALARWKGMRRKKPPALLGVSRKAVESRIYRARQKLAALLEG